MIKGEESGADERVSIKKHDACQPLTLEHRTLRPPRRDPADGLGRLLPETQPGDDLLVALQVVLLYVVQQTAPPSDHPQQTLA